MSSPRKYTSPYLSAIPGLTTAKSNKKRSKTSIKLNESLLQIEEHIKSMHSSVCLKPETNFDASCGDVTQKFGNELTDVSKIGAILENMNDEHEIVEGAAALSLNPVLHTGETNATIVKEKVCCNPGGQNYCEETFELPEYLRINDSDSENNNATALKSILKKPIHYKDKDKYKAKFDITNETTKKSTKSPKAKKVSKGETKETPNRTLVKPKTGVKSTSKIDVRSSQSIKSPRKKSKCSFSNIESRTTTDPSLLLLPKKIVRFSNRIDVYSVPYESRAGTRACDWQRNMMEQRMNSFRQLMKEVSPEELEFLGNGTLFSGYPPYHVPNPNFAIRGRGIRNFNNFKL